MEAPIQIVEQTHFSQNGYTDYSNAPCPSVNRFIFVFSSLNTFVTQSDGFYLYTLCTQLASFDMTTAKSASKPVTKNRPVWRLLHKPGLP